MIVILFVPCRWKQENRSLTRFKKDLKSLKKRHGCYTVNGDDRTVVFVSIKTKLLQNLNLITKLASGCIHFIYRRKVQLLIHFETVLFANGAWSNSINKSIKRLFVKIYSFPQS